jgi:hypothetical protein
LNPSSLSHFRSKVIPTKQTRHLTPRIQHTKRLIYIS